MVDTYGRWTEEPDYTSYPAEKWCALDHVANWIRSCKYVPKHGMENLVNMILDHIETDADYTNMAYGADGMPDIQAVSEFVYESGGIKEFDYSA